MATFNPASDLNEETSGLCCSICLDQYEDPRSLTCLHTFCERCIHDIVMKLKDKGPGIECPLCRKVTVIKDKKIPPEQWSKTIPNNYALLDVLEALKLDVKSKETLDMCPTHNKVIEFFCQEEEALCCSICALNKVKEGKEVSEISDIAWNENRTLFQPLQKQIHDLNLQANNIKVFLNKAEENLETRVDILQVELNTVQDKMIEKIERARGDILSQLNTLGKGCVIKLQDQKTKCGDLIAAIAEEAHSLNLAIRYKTPSQLFIDLHKLRSKINQLQAGVDDQLAQSKHVYVEFKANECVNEFIQNDLRFGYLGINEASVSGETLQDYRKARLRVVGVMRIEAIHIDNKQPLYSGMKFLSNGDLLTIDNANWKCEVRDYRLKQKGLLQFATHVFDVVEVSTGVIYVTGAKRLERVVVDNCGGLTPAGTIGVESCPFSISVLDEEQFVVGTYRTQTPVRVISKSGEESEWNIEFPQKHWKIDSSRCAYNKQNKLLVLSDRFDDCVYIYDTQIRHEIRVKNDHIIEPRGVTFGPNSCVFVCSKGTNSIVQLSRYGELIHNYQLDIICPCTLCFSADNKRLAVSNSYGNDRKLVIFEVKEV